MSCNTCCKKVRHVPLIIFFALLTGCASSARYTEMAVKNAEVNITVKKNSVFAKNIAIEKLTGGKKTNPLWLSQVDNEGFFKALKSSLLNLGYLSSDPKARFQLVVSLEKLKQPFLGFAFDCKVTCRTKYALYDSKLKKSVFEQTIATPYIAPFLSELYSVKRIRLANEGAVKENIKQFLQVLGALNTKS